MVLTAKDLGVLIGISFTTGFSYPVPNETTDFTDSDSSISHGPNRSDFTDSRVCDSIRGEASAHATRY